MYISIFVEVFGYALFEISCLRLLEQFFFFLFFEIAFCLWISSYIGFFLREGICVYNRKRLDGFFTLSKKLFFPLGRLAYVQYDTA